MDNNDNHIDEVFRQRFEGLKDHTVSPTDQWVGVQHSLSGTAPAAATAGTSGVGSVWGLAASVSGIVVLSTVATLDSPRQIIDTESVGISELSDDQDFQYSSDETLTWAQAERSSAQLESQVEAYNQQRNLVQSDEPVALLNERNVLQELAEASEGTSYATDQERGNLAFMEPVSPAAYSPHGVIDRAALDKAASSVQAGSMDGLYVRGGIRLGNGESNSNHIDASWRVNNVLAAGMAYHITPKTFLSLELGHLRRSGNGIERSKDVNFGPLIGVIASAYDDEALAGVLSELEHIRESLVATSMDYIHMPIQVHVDLSDQSNASVGFFTDYLLRVRNESYMVYNSHDYISRNFGINDDRTKEGLKTLRFGLMAGYQHSLSSKLSADLRGMIPITSQYDRNSDYSVHSEPSQMVDFQLSLIYKI